MHRSLCRLFVPISVSPDVDTTRPERFCELDETQPRPLDSSSSVECRSVVSRVVCAAQVRSAAAFDGRVSSTFARSTARSHRARASIRVLTTRL
eukprot:5323586-Pleurochrysis_carterae.AAC.1